MPIITITQFSGLAQEGSGHRVPVGAGYQGKQKLTALGAANAVASGARFVRIATDTDCYVDAAAEGVSEEFLPAGTVEWFAVKDEQVLTFTAV